jgi:hypothetical protein
MTGNSKVLPSGGKPRPPNAGKGRQKGVPNKSTRAVKDALQAVYADLQESAKDKGDNAKGDNGHLFAWAEGNPTEFYKLWAKMLPTEISGPDGGPIAAQLTDELAALPKNKRDAIRAAVAQAMGAA